MPFTGLHLSLPRPSLSMKTVAILFFVYILSAFRGLNDAFMIFFSQELRVELIAPPVMLRCADPLRGRLILLKPLLVFDAEQEGVDEVVIAALPRVVG